MKVIAQVGQDEVLMQATADEIRMMLGFNYSHLADDAGFGEKRITRVGFEIDIKEINRNSQFLRSLSKEHIDRLKDTLDGINKHVLELDIVAEKMILFDTLANIEDAK